MTWNILLRIFYIADEETDGSWDWSHANRYYNTQHEVEPKDNPYFVYIWFRHSKDAINFKLTNTDFTQVDYSAIV